MRIWSIGEVLWDIFPGHETFGGAPLNVCANLQRLGNETLLLSAVGTDRRGQLALQRMQALGLSIRGIETSQSLPTGVAQVAIDKNGDASFVIPRPAAFDDVSVDAAFLDSAKDAQVDWLYYGTLLQTSPRAEEFTTLLKTTLTKIRTFYDMNLRAGHWSLELIQRLSLFASILKLNDEEARILFQLTNPEGSIFSFDRFCHDWSARHAIDVICITLGPRGCLIYDRGKFHRVPGFKVKVADTVGAGDAFAAAFLHGFHQNWPIVQTARFANALGAIVASRDGATPSWSLDEVKALDRSRTLDIGL